MSCPTQEYSRSQDRGASAALKVLVRWSTEHLKLRSGRDLITCVGVAATGSASGLSDV